MPDEKPTTKWSKLKTFFKWFFFLSRCFFACFFAALLITGLLYALPVKILFIITFTLITLTLFPKRIRKIIYLTCSIILLSALIWVYLPEDDTGFIPYTFDDELTALRARLTIENVPNAANTYNEIFDSIDKDTFDLVFVYHDESSQTLTAPWLSTDHPQIDRWLKQNIATIDKLMVASDINYCLFPLPATPPQSDDQFERLSLFLRWAGILARSANNDLANKKFDDAIKKQLAALKMAGHLYQQKTLLDMSKGLTIELMAVDNINRTIINRPLTEQQLDLIIQTLDLLKNDFENDWPHILDCNKLFVKNIVGLLYHIDKQGNIRLTRNLAGDVGKYFGVARHYHYPNKKIAKAMVLAQWLVIPSSPQAAGKVVDRSFEKYDLLVRKKHQSADGDKSDKHRQKLNFRHVIDRAAHEGTSYFYPMYNQSLRRISTANSTRIIIALKQYKNQNGSFPETLDSLSDYLAPDDMIDPISEDAFVYRSLGESFMLYSKGKNKVDDDGISFSKENKDDHLIFPPKHPLLIQGQKNEM
jgi:hypothetical protein